MYLLRRGPALNPNDGHQMGTDVAISTPSGQSSERCKDKGFLFNEESGFQ